MKKVIVSLIILSGFYAVDAQNIVVTDDDSYTANPSAMLDVKSITKGLLVPRMSTAQRIAITSPANGLLVFDTDEQSYYFYSGSASAWTQISYGQIWEKNTGFVFLADPNDNVGVGVNNPGNKLLVKADASNGVNEAIFAVQNNDGDTIFAVYPEGVRVWVNDDGGAKATGNRGGFAVGGFSPSKAGLTNEYLRVTPDSVRIYIEENGTGAKATGNRGGFAVGGFSPSKGPTSQYFNVSYDSTETIFPSEPRSVWYPSKEAFLAGRVLIESIDSVGFNSTALGFESKPIGNYSQAFGFHARAYGNNSTAIGNYANANANNSFAFGDSAQAKGVGSYAFGAQGRDTLTGQSMGNPAIASGDHSFALGLGASAENLCSFAIGTNSTASGEYSAALGLYNNAIGNQAIAIGSNNDANGAASVALGANNETNFAGDVAIGTSNTCTGPYYPAYAFGYGCNSTGSASIALGWNTDASGGNSLAANDRTTASGSGAVAINYFTTAGGRWSFAGGSYASTSADYAFSFGYMTSATGIGSRSFGYSTTASGNYSTAMGREITASGDYSFAIALNDQNGTNVSANNVMAVMGGKVGIGKTNPTYHLDVVGDGQGGDDGEMMIASNLGTGGNATLYLAEDNDNTYGMYWRYNGSANQLRLFGTSGGTQYGAHMRVGRDNGEIDFPAVYSDGLTGTVRDLYIQSDGQIGYNASSKRYKKNIKDMENTDWLYKLRPVNFVYKKDTLNIMRYGLIAEEVDKVNPDFVSYNPDGTCETVSYGMLVTPMIKEIQILKKTVDDLTEENFKLKAEIDKNNENKDVQIEQLKAEIEKIKETLNLTVKK